MRRGCNWKYNRIRLRSSAHLSVRTRSFGGITAVGHARLVRRRCRAQRRAPFPLSFYYGHQRSLWVSAPPPSTKPQDGRHTFRIILCRESLGGHFALLSYKRSAYAVSLRSTTRTTTPTSSSFSTRISFSSSFFQFYSFAFFFFDALVTSDSECSGPPPPEFGVVGKRVRCVISRLEAL